MEQEKNNKDFDSMKYLKSGERVSIVQIQMKRTGKSLCGVGPLNSPAAVKDMD